MTAVHNQAASDALWGEVVGKLNESQRLAAKRQNDPPAAARATGRTRPQSQAAIDTMWAEVVGEINAQLPKNAVIPGFVEE